MDIQDCRNRIDHIDEQLQELFQERMNVAAEISRLKSKNAISTINAEREREILLKVDDRSPRDLHVYNRVLFTTLFDLSRSYQNRLRYEHGLLNDTIANAIRRNSLPERGQIACQGVEGAYSQQACEKLFALPGITYFRSFSGVAQAVERGLCQYGILPIENSSNGTVNAVYDLVRDHKFYIVRSLKLHIRHSLVARPGATLDGIRESYTFDVTCQGSVPQAFEAFFESEDFEDAVRNAVSIGGDSDTIAAIAGGLAEAFYGVPVCLREQAVPFLFDYQKDILEAFEARYGIKTEG